MAPLHSAINAFQQTEPFYGRHVDLLFHVLDKTSKPNCLALNPGQECVELLSMVLFSAMTVNAKQLWVNAEYLQGSPVIECSFPSRGIPQSTLSRDTPLHV